jgi:hypothetical protein
MCFTLTLAYALALASVINYDCKWCYNLEHHLLTTLAVSITIIICLKYRPQIGALLSNECRRSLYHYECRTMWPENWIKFLLILGKSSQKMPKYAKICQNMPKYLHQSLVQKPKQLHRPTFLNLKFPTTNCELKLCA